MAYISADAPPSLYLRDTESGEEQKLLLPAGEGESEPIEAGNIVWAPAGDAVVLTIAI